MNKFFLISFLFLCQLGYSQSSEKENLQNLIENFFSAFHAKDSIALKNFAHPEIKMHSVAIDVNGKTMLSTEDYTDFLRAIASIPETTKFREKLHGFKIHINGVIANVSTPYSFYVNDELSHCGVNTFQLMKFKGQWKIIYLVDTRSKLGCE
ncbi:nuclear transport factor 2 family protein [Salegentibacter sp. BLCTC]|uniref:nuclear transport factor 2 family protein n=1 Tax=Salegentibacter sp. BLCTC TaxID=2697368 RepID=UPI00187B749A|nr:nuclear transport factor 2 family protein [Salegentibacter sp. BLCTC]MBE7639288.1 nuclear transport factor 2 family protein [Salegentibacter sp. BLCTC]